MSVYIYGIYSPLSKNVYYVGASNNPKQRFTRHRYGGEWHPITSKYKEARALYLARIAPELIIFDEVDISKAAYWEEFYVQLIKSWGFKLCQGSNYYPSKITPSFRSLAKVKSEAFGGIAGIV